MNSKDINFGKLLESLYDVYKRYRHEIYRLIILFTEFFVIVTFFSAACIAPGWDFLYYGAIGLIIYLFSIFINFSGMISPYISTKVVLLVEGMTLVTVLGIIAGMWLKWHLC